MRQTPPHPGQGGGGGGGGGEATSNLPLLNSSRGCELYATASLLNEGEEEKGV